MFNVIKMCIYKIFKQYFLSFRIFVLFIIILLNNTLGFSMDEHNRVVVDEINKNKMLIGETTLDVFKSSPFKGWFDLEYNYYEPDEKIVDQLKDISKGIKILIFLGTWCPDSRTDFPRFVKILDKIHFDKSNLKIISVDRKKEDPDGLSKKYNIEYVPTFIFFDGKAELGRIVEMPKISLEADMLKILTNK